ncbi:DUF2931 family protein [Pedobacter aquatilis]|uniref:DUF2931 family protein n=1 Tax=Pedobacter aquatilis TaxID=351343 RepID=UPI00292F82E2|nr:DUF2931 family protein [Pedobacter aquatilis]
MKLNKLNIFYIAVAIFLIAGIVYRKISFKAWERYNYSVAVVSPKTYPMHIRETYFLLPDDDFESADKEDVNNFNSTWGVSFATTNHARLKRLPTQLVVKYFSYRDNNFYADTLDLPKKEILTTFKNAKQNKQFLELSSYAGKKDGLSFVIGLANNGNLIIWLRGIYLEKELLRKRLKPKNPLKADLYHERNLSREKYFEYAFENLSDSLKTVYKSGFDGKANYIDTPSRYIEMNKELWEYQQKNGYIDFKK